MHPSTSSSVVVAALVCLAACSSSPSRSGFRSNDQGRGGTLGGDNPTCYSDPSYFDVPGNGCDDDGDGTIDNPPTCDDTLSETGGADDFARAIGICTRAEERGYGLVSAEYTRGFGQRVPGNDGQHGILPKFGDIIRPREGAQLGVLSTGYAQEWNGEPGVGFGGEGLFGGPTGVSKDWGSVGSLPAGFPQAAQGCQQSSDVHDAIDVRLTLKAPANAVGVLFDFNFFSSEWPVFICSAYNDGFIAYLTSKALAAGSENVSYDMGGNPISVNNGFFDRCTPNVDTGCAPGARRGKSTCTGGPAELAGTGYGLVHKWCEPYSLLGAGGKDESTNGGATGWLMSSAPVEPGETFTLDFIIWDTGDGSLDSSVLLDNFRWTDGTVATETRRPN
jgi:hypothetical protein